MRGNEIGNKVLIFKFPKSYWRSSLQGHCSCEIIAGIICEVARGGHGWDMHFVFVTCDFLRHLCNLLHVNLPPKEDPHALASSPTHNLGDLGNLFEFWERSIVLINLGINKDSELVLHHYSGVKNVRHLPCGFKFSRFNIPESSIRGKTDWA